MKKLSEVTRGDLPLTVQHLCDLRDAMLLQWPPSTQPLPREAGDFPTGEKYPKDVPLPTYLAYFSSKVIT